jgi:mono/diheme cytochrome c family protein
MSFNRDSNWSFPTGAVWIKHFELELTNGVPESRRRLETRFIVRNTNGVYGVTYRWDDAQTNATLVPEAGLDDTFVIHDGSTTRTQVWHYPARNECLSCHTTAGGGTLGFTSAQLNRDFDYSGTVENELRALSDAGYFSAPVTNINILPAHPAMTNQAASLESRVRSYLAANCANCHQPGGTTSALFDARASTLTANAGLVNGPLNNAGNNSENRVIKPGSSELSMLLQRISRRGAGQMPPIASTVVDTNAVQLVTDWINTEATTFQSFQDWQASHFTDPQAPDAAAGADPDADNSSNYLEFLLGTDPQAANLAWQISAHPGAGTIEIHYPQIARRGFEVQSTSDLFIPDSWQPLDVFGNAPFFSSTDREAVIEDTATASSPKFYRVRVFER